MADQKVSDLAALSPGAITTNLLLVVDAGAGIDYKMTVADFIASIVGATAGTVCAGDDGRLSDARPTAIPSNPVGATTNGVLYTDGFGTLAQDPNFQYNGAGNLALIATNSSFYTNNGTWGATAQGPGGGPYCQLGSSTAALSAADGLRSVALCDLTYAVNATVGAINSEWGYYAGGTPPAPDGTSANPTSITIKGGIITAIS